jgi:hypothetical protein
VLFDQAIPVPIRTFLIGHTVRTAAQQHWNTLKNGELLTVAEQAGFEVFLTTDKNMRHQQNIAGRTIAVVVVGVQQWPASSRMWRSSWPPSTPRRLAASLGGYSGGLTARTVSRGLRSSPLIRIRPHLSRSVEVSSGSGSVGSAASPH